jgi:hypothetical protein
VSDPFDDSWEDACKDGIAAALFWILVNVTGWVFYVVGGIALFRLSGENTVVLLFLAAGWCWLIVRETVKSEGIRAVGTTLVWVMLVGGLIVAEGWDMVSALGHLVFFWFIAFVILLGITKRGTPGRGRSRASGRDVSMAGRHDYDSDDGD